MSAEESPPPAMPGMSSPSPNLKYAEQVDVVINSDMGRFKKGRQLRKIFTQKDAELEQLLTEEQYEEYLTLRDEIKKEMHAKK